MSDARRANAAAAIVIVLAGALSSLWVFLVPIFQAPDEPAHFDYAMSIYGAHRLIRLSDGSTDWIVSPYTKYLLKTLDFSRVAMNSSMRVPTGYGARAYFAKLDADAPSLERSIQPTGRINYIVPAYPFAFYALEALWMHGVSLFTGSLTAVFFGARILCVFLLMLGLYFNYRTAINLSVPRWTSVALIGAIGFFPMTSFVSSYIQPDNLAYALVSASLFFATQLRTRILGASTVQPLAVALALLAVTKYQCFITVALPISFLVAVRLIQTKARLFQAGGIVAALVVPSIALLAAQHWIVGQSDPGGRSNIASGMGLDYFRSVIALGFPAMLRYAAGSIGAAFVDFFVSGPSAATFWQVFGWGDTPIFIFNGTIELWIRASIALATIAVVVAIAFLLVRNGLRIGIAMARGHRSVALAVAAADPVFTSYILFAALMFTLYVLTNNAFGAEGRHWYPLIFPAFLCLVWYAPRTIWRRSRVVASAVLAIGLCCYSLVAAAYAIPDVAYRYYGPASASLAATDPGPTQLAPDSAAGVLWRVKSATYQVAEPAVPAFPLGSELIVSGAALPTTSSAASFVAAAVDGRPTPVVSGEYQFAVAEATRNLRDAYSQFYGTLSTARLGEGPHIVVAYAEAADGRHFQQIPITRTFFLTGIGGRFSSAFVRLLQQVPATLGDLQGIGTCRGLSSLMSGMRATTSGGVILLGGDIRDPRRAAYRAVWLLADSRPYPTRYDERTRSFVGTIPTAGLALGLHQVTAYAIGDRPASTARISQSAEFRILPGHGQSEFLAEPPSACNDPLKQLAGT